MTQRLIVCVTLAASVLTACGGGSGSSTAGGVAVIPTPVAASPMPVASNPPAAAPAVQAQLLGSAGWTSKNGMTLYVFAADAANVSNCNSACAIVWPPLAASSSDMATGNFTVITRADGSHQWAYKSQPLYNYTGDLKPGDTNGNGLNQFGGLWSIARP